MASIVTVQSVMLSRLDSGTLFFILVIRPRSSSLQLTVGRSPHEQVEQAARPRAELHHHGRASLPEVAYGDDGDEQLGFSR